jgi:spermidine synthase
VSHVFLDTSGGHLRLYLNGDLQFDARDERLYHEPLALLPIALAASRAPRRALRVLILGGGDGLALREVLRVAEVREAHVVDRDPEVLRLGRGPLAELNRGAFRDPRVRVHVLDAREFLGRARGFDVLIYDLTYPDDVAGAALFSVPLFRKARAALRPAGLLGVNAVSPELTPQGFGCVGATLGAAGLWAVPYALALPSFLEEGYGRWGFLFASPRSIARAELRRLRLPEGTELTAETVLAATRVPAAARGAMEAAPNRTDELLYYLHNAAPLAWAAPWRALRFRPGPGEPGPRLTAAQGFARWLHEPAGRRSLEELLRCLPLSRRGQTREALLDWSQHAETLLRELDLRAFVDTALRRAGELPRAWVRELRALRARIRDGLPSLRDLLEHAYRVFAIYLLVLLLVNLFFPDNLYAKGFSSSGTRSSSSSSGSSGESLPFYGFNFTAPGLRPIPYGFRPSVLGEPAWAPTRQPRRVFDPLGREYPARNLALADPQGTRRTIPSLVALTPELQVLESGALACTTAPPGYQCLLEPGRVRVLDADGREILALLPPRELEAEAPVHLDAQGRVLERAIQDHRRWVEWVRWAAPLPQGVEAISELARLEAIRKAVETGKGVWVTRPPAPAVTRSPRWVPVTPGIYLEPAQYAHQDPTLVLVHPDGSVHRRPVAPPTALTDEDRFVFGVLNQRLTQGRDQSLAGPVARWVERHGAALGVSPPATPAPRS